MRAALVALALLLCGCPRPTTGPVEPDPFCTSDEQCDDACVEGECRQSCTTVEQCQALGPYRWCAGGLCWAERPPDHLLRRCDTDPPLRSCT